MSKMISFLQNLILIIACYAYVMFLLYLSENNEFIKGIFNFFMTNIKNKDVAVVIFGIPFLAIPIVIIQIIWKKIFHR